MTLRSIDTGFLNLSAGGVTGVVDTGTTKTVVNSLLARCSKYLLHGHTSSFDAQRSTTSRRPRRVEMMARRKDCVLLAVRSVERHLTLLGAARPAPRGTARQDTDPPSGRDDRVRLLCSVSGRRILAARVLNGDPKAFHVPGPQFRNSPNPPPRGP